jgi:hypothetical protein
MYNVSCLFLQFLFTNKVVKIIYIILYYPSILTEDNPIRNHYLVRAEDSMGFRSYPSKTEDSLGFPPYPTNDPNGFLVVERLSALGTSATVGLLYQPRMIDDDDYGAVGGMRIGRGN